LNDRVEYFFAQASILRPNDVNLAYYCSSCDKAYGRIERREIWFVHLEEKTKRERVLRQL
jgi:hypothetical protein